jgi:glycosyltransferase involved in cell wall biosynthesis
MSKMNVTVAVCTWNRRDLLARTLEEFTRLRVDPGVAWEVLVIDNGSTDGTAEFLASRPPDGLRLRWVVESRTGLSSARNRALAENRSDLILFVDDDVLVDPDLLNALVAASRRNPDAAAFGGVIQPWFVTDPDPILASAFPALRRGFCGIDGSPVESPLATGHHLVGANMAYRRAAVEGLAFREDLGPCGSATVGGDEIDFQERLRARGGIILWVPTMRLRHYVDPTRMTLPYLLRFAEDAGRKEVRLHGVPRGARIAGIPRWLVGCALKEHVRSVACRIRFNRVQALVHRRKAAEFGGMVKECRSSHLQRRHVGAAALAART